MHSGRFIIKLRLAKEILKFLKPIQLLDMLKTFSVNLTSKSVPSLLNKLLLRHGFQPAKEGQIESGIYLLCIDGSTLDSSIMDFINQLSFYEILVLNIDKNNPKVLGRSFFKKIGLFIPFFSLPEVEMAITIYIRRFQKIAEVIGSDYVKENLVGESRVWIHFLHQLIETSLFTDMPILLIGESGTGKEALARLVHTISEKRRDENIVLLDCTTIMPDLWGSEFFGHEKGAFTGAISSREGAFAQANRGTLFLDEVGELSPHLQSALLRVVEDGIFKKVGTNYYMSTDFRLVCATNRNLKEEVKIGNFRQDLYYRIACGVFKVPSLRERKEDLPLLCNHFFSKKPNGLKKLEFSEQAKNELYSYEYPGNVRELKFIIEHIAAKHPGFGSVLATHLPDLQDDELPEHSTQNICSFELMAKEALSKGMHLGEIKYKAINAVINEALKNGNGSTRQAAKALGINERTIQMRLSAIKTEASNESFDLSH